MLRTLPGLLLLIVLVATGCTHSFTSQELQSKTLPFHGQPVDEDTWEAISRVNPAAPQISSRSTVFPFPSVLVFRSFSNIRPDGRFSATSFTWWDGFLGAFGISLPLAINYNDYHYSPGEAEPIAHRSALYTPFWATSSSRGDFNLGMDIEASGIPILWTRLKITETLSDGSTGTATKTAFLWTLGPALIRLRANDGQSNGYLATPLLLGGMLGGLVWADYRLREGDTHRIGHGPLLGFLGYTQWQNHTGAPDAESAPTETRFRRMLLGGALWEQTRRSDYETGELRSASHGPLWGMFGWGRKGEDFALRIFWYPVTF